VYVKKIFVVCGVKSHKSKYNGMYFSYFLKRAVITVCIGMHRRRKLLHDSYHKILNSYFGHKSIFFKKIGGVYFV